MWVAALSFPTALLAEGLSHYDAVGQQTVVAIYTGTFLLGALLFNVLWWYAIYRGRLLHRSLFRSYTGQSPDVGVTARRESPRIESVPNRQTAPYRAA
jgi:hypothetical protein